MSRSSAIALRYARALFGLREGAGDRARLLGELDTLTDEILASADLQRVLFTPIHARRERRGVIADLCTGLDVSNELRAFSQLLVDENRSGELPAIRDALRELVDREAGRLVAQIRSARPLDESELGALQRELSRRVDADVALETEVDPDLIGGVVARVGDLLLDGSVRTQLQSLGAILRKGSAS